MRLTLCVPPAGRLIALGLLAAPGFAQVGHNEVMRFGGQDMVQAARHATTNLALEVPGAQPAAYMATATTGVAAGTLTWIWYPSQTNLRYEDHLVTGHLIGVRPSSATPFSDYAKTHTGQTSSGVPVYIPKFSIYPAKQRTGASTAFGKGFDPDFSKAPLLTYNTVHTPLVQPNQADKALVWTVTYNKAVAVKSKELVLTFEWRGGEHFNKPRSQSLPTGYSESHFSPSHWGWAAPGPGRAITRFDPAKILPGQKISIYTSPMGGYFESRSTLAMHSSWGENRNAALSGSVYPSYNPGTYVSDFSSKAGALGWDVYSSSANRGRRVWPLLNFKTKVHPTGTPYGPHMLEVDTAQPLLMGLLGFPNVDGALNVSGLFLPSKRLKSNKLGPSALGVWIGLEYGIVDMGGGGIVDTTQSVWFYIAK